MRADGSWQPVNIGTIVVLYEKGCGVNVTKDLSASVLRQKVAPVLDVFQIQQTVETWPEGKKCVAFLVRCALP